MMKRRKDRVHKQNVEEVGEHDPAFEARYKKMMQEQHRKAGLKDLTKAEREQKELEDKYYNKYDKPAEDLPDDAIQVDVFTHDTRKRRFKKSEIFTEAEDPDPDRSKMTSASHS